MKKVIIAATVLISSVIYFSVIRPLGNKIKEESNVSVETNVNKTENSTNMQIQSPAFENNKMIPKKFTCDGQRINPELNFLDVPSKAKSLVLIVDDPDAPHGTFTHWVVYNIVPKLNKVLENSVPEGGISGVTSIGKPGFIGPCPPSGVHRYFFKLYALDIKLNLPENATVEEVEKAMEGHIMTSSQIIGLYGRN